MEDKSECYPFEDFEKPSVEDEPQPVQLKYEDAYEVYLFSAFSETKISNSLCNRNS